MALVIGTPSIPFEITHASIYSQAAAQMPPGDFIALSQRQPLLMQSAEAFKDILKYYEIKPAYILAARVFHFLGFDLVGCTYIPSIISYFFIGCLLFVWLQRMFDIQIASVITLLIAVSPFLITSARYSSPDMMCAAFSLAGLFFISEASVIVGLLLFILSIPVRPDAVILFLFVILALYKSKKFVLKSALAFSAIGMVATLLVIGDITLLKEFLFTLPSYYSSQSMPGMMERYGRGLWYGLNSVMNSQTVIFSFLAVVTVYLGAKGNKITDNLWSLLMIATLAAFILRYLLHPMMEDRFQITSYLIIIIGFCKTISNQLPMYPKQISHSTSSGIL